MSTSVDATLTRDAIELNKKNRSIVKLVLEWNIDELGEALQEYVDLKKKIKKTLIDYPVAKIHDKLAQDVLTRVIQDDPFQADNVLKMFESKSDEPLEFEKLDYSEIEELQDLFYSWYSHYEYLEGLYEIGSLIIGYSIPEALSSYVSEARSCFAFQQYNAVYGLCRTILEAAIRHRCERKGLLRPSGSQVLDFESYQPSELINKATKGQLRERVKNIYSNTSTLLHGRKTVSSGEAKKMFRDTLKAVQDLYEN